MNTWLKNLILTFIVIVAPSVMIDVLFYEMPDLGESIIMVAAGIYAITITGLVLFYRYPPCSIWVLPLAFALPVPICYVKDTLDDSEYFTYAYTGLVLFYYSLPMGSDHLLHSICLCHLQEYGTGEALPSEKINPAGGAEMGAQKAGTAVIRRCPGAGFSLPRRDVVRVYKQEAQGPQEYHPEN